MLHKHTNRYRYGYALKVKLIDESCQPVWLSLYRNQAGMINDAVLNENEVLVF